MAWSGKASWRWRPLKGFLKEREVGASSTGRAAAGRAQEGDERTEGLGCAERSVSRSTRACRPCAAGSVGAAGGL